MSQAIYKDVQKLHQEMQTWRRHIHAHPEIAFQEVHTAHFVEERLLEAGFASSDIQTGIAGTGIVASLRSGIAEDTPTIALRADLDALAIHEKNSFAHCSNNHGVMHACGHDGHTAMLLGAAKYLKNSNEFKGHVKFIFQPAEENEGGARAMVAAGLFEEHPCNQIYGMHNWPGLTEGIFAVQSGPVMAAYDNFDIEIQARGGHAAMPDQTIDPIIIAGEIILALQSLISRANPGRKAVLSITRLDAGSSYNIIPETALLRGTVRALEEETQQKLSAGIENLACGIARAHGAKAKIKYEYGYPVTINTPAEAEMSARVVRQTFGEEHLTLDEPPSMGSEDFAFLLQHHPGCYIRLGAGPGISGCMLHNSGYDFNDNLLSMGATYWVALAQEFTRAMQA